MYAQTKQNTIQAAKHRQRVFWNLLRLKTPRNPAGMIFFCKHEEQESVRKGVKVAREESKLRVSQQLSQSREYLAAHSSSVSLPE